MNGTTMTHTFRPATATDLDGIMAIIAEAKEQMCREGKHQWDDTYPVRHHIETDIRNGSAYVMASAGRLVAYGAVVFSGEPAYTEIEGRWLTDWPYVVLHRLAVAERTKGHGIGALFIQEAERLAVRAGIHSFKIDTNHDNTRMLRLLTKMGFTYCGTIHYQQCSRMAYEKLLE